MNRFARILSWLAAGVLLSAAKGEDIGSGLVGGGLLVALGLELSLPFGLLLHAWRPALVAQVGAAYDRKGTAALLVGSGLLVALFIAVAIFSNIAWQLGVLVVLIGHGYLLIGFAGCSRRQGMRMLGDTAAPPEAVRPLVLGWLARAGVTGTPLLWPVVCIYLTAGALGAPLVAWFGRKSGRADTPDGADTTD